MENVEKIEVVEPIIVIGLNSGKNELIEFYPEFIINENQHQGTTKKNLVVELKKNFPKVKFSVKKEFSDCYSVTWFESVTIEEVDNVVRKFIDHQNDVSGDFRDYTPTNFNKLFGGFKFISTYRNFGDSKELLLEKLGELMNDTDRNYPNNVSDTLYRLLRKTSFPIGAKVIGIKKDDNFKGGNSEDSFTIIFDKNTI
ncbi:LPD29 domain-containing protein [Flavobacterium daejeonense]|uniref:LPD29 domain-containing protein n=1 Tax=Flavobacterium daejeonense TaxID=350893 RepID=UPI00047B9528|nr:LPD29 domain-containing protein [Flavobacterium daejeonense]